MEAYFFKVRQNWRNALYHKAFRTSLIFGFVMLVALFVFTYFYFDYIEHLPNGTVLNDWVLRKLPAKDVSAPIVFLEASVFILLFVRSSANPVMFLTFLISSILVFATRDITIGITLLRAPMGIIELKDPISDVVYRSGFIERDLFYSGHVSLLFLIYLCLYKKPDKYYTLFAVISVGLLILIQHVHYTVDVISAPFFSLVCFWAAKRILRFQHIKYIYNA
jgi:hypothetical protein